jgi:hypothetical protein
MRTVLSAALTRAVREELIARNVARLVELPEWRPKPPAISDLKGGPGTGVIRMALQEQESLPPVPGDDI